jgi:hypothetical protein
MVFRLPSMGRNTWILGYSQGRIGFAAVLAVPLVILTVIAIRGSKDRHRIAAWAARAADYLGSGSRHFNLLSVLTFAALLGFSMILFFSSSILDVSDVHRVLFDRASPAVIWASVAAAQAAAVLVTAYPGVVKEPGYLTRAALRRNVFVGILVLGALVQWAILYFRLDVFTRIPHWYWLFRENPGAQAWLFIPISMVAMVLSVAVLEWARSVRLKVVLLVALGYLLQLGFGWIEGDGWLSLRERYLHGGRPIYSEIVNDDGFSLESILEYERRFADVYSLAAKPPGYLAVYALTNVLVNPAGMITDQAARIERLTTFMALAFPLLALAVIPILVGIGRQFLGAKGAPVVGLMFVSFPGFILLTLQLDQVLFPLLAVLTLHSAISASTARSPARKAVTGFLAYVSLYFSFTLFPVLIIVVVWEFFYSLAFARESWLRTAIRGTAGFAIGLLAGYLLLRTLLGYDIATRVRHAMQFLAETPHAPRGLSSQGPALLLDSAEMAMWLGFGVIIILLSQVFATAAAWRRRAPTKPDVLLLCGAALAPMLALVAPTRGEVARLGLFLLPVIALYLARGLEGLSEGTPRLVYAFIGSQWVTALLILKFQFPWQ